MKALPFVGALFALLAVDASCDQRFEPSAIVDLVVINRLIASTAEELKIEARQGVGEGSGGMFRGIMETEFHLKCGDDQRKELMQRLRSVSRTFIENQGGTIHGVGVRGSIDDLVGFSWEYNWHEHNGFMIVRYHEGDSARGRVVILCYEHTRLGPEVPAATEFYDSSPLKRSQAEPGATDNPDDAQRLREDH